MLFFVYGAICALVSVAFAVGKENKIVSGIISFFLMGCIAWFLQPTLSLFSVGTWLCVLIAIVIPIIGNALVGADEGMGTRLTICVGYLLFMVGFMFVSTKGFIHHNEYKSLIGEQVETEFSAKTMAPVKIEQARKIDEEHAKILASTLVSELGSQSEIGDMNLQLVNGDFVIYNYEGERIELSIKNELYWVTPMVHTDWFKSNSNGYTHGYVMVSSSNENKKYFVTALERKANSTQETSRMGGSANQAAEVEKLKLKYLVKGGFFGSYLPRYLRSNGYLSEFLTDYTFEIDDEGRPYWVVTKYDKTVGFSGGDATGVVLVDAQTGEIKEETIESAPTWVDRIQPMDFVKTQLNDYGEYINGPFNWSGVDRETTTPGMSIVVGSDNRLYFYTGIQSNGSDVGSKAFVLVDSRTKQVFRYKVKGIKEDKVVTTLESKVSEKGYQATSPILYNVKGRPTYFAALKGNDKTAKMYGFMSLKGGTQVGVGETVKEALRSYERMLRNSGSVKAFDDLVNNTTIETKVVNITKESLGKSVYYYMLLDGLSGKEFYMASSDSLELKWTKPGDIVSVSYSEGDNINSIILDQFDNKAYSIQNAK